MGGMQTLVLLRSMYSPRRHHRLCKGGSEFTIRTDAT